MENTSNDNKSKKRDQTNKSFLGNSARDYKKQKSRETQRLQSLKKTSPVDILLKKIQPSLSEREWIINQRRRNVSSITSAKDKGKERRDISKSKIKKSIEVSGINKSEDKQKLTQEVDRNIGKERKT
ncbi:hypothetical protein DBV15_09619 [Temnothorax longispinosus]|uniref:Uncharacterized protein n=1 Tax=Temnothorax longispinosus TaxID=300112 RepID=A0A4S2L804_9HYME|nr:hypothetical protein DBV15_09621 [Temnothorax longispinosus]TGZ58406.1 hypothetical protein DBV15_09619 [Temnothorax longispinosus]